MRPCNYSTGTDKRKISLKFVVDLLVKRIDELHQFINYHELTPPSMFDANEAALIHALDTLGLRHIKMTLKEMETRDRPVSHELRAQHHKVFDSNEATVVENLDMDHLDSTIDLLSEPFMVLEHQDSYQLHSDPSSSFPGTSNEPFLRTADNPVDDSQASLTSTGESDLQALSNTSIPCDSSTTHDNRQIPQSNPVQPASLKGTEGSSILQTNPQDSDDLEDIVHRLSDRMGSLQIGSDGRFRYYGPTSHFNLLQMPTPDNMTVHRTVRKDGWDYLHRLGLDLEVPPGMEEHLTNLFFTWHSPSIDVVDRNMYEMAKQQWNNHMEDTPYYSDALTNAMCCLGAAFEARYHPTFITYPKSLSDFFADRAKILLEIELDSPTVATVQAMVVLSGHDIGCRRDARGWLYSGMAMRLAFDLGLHLDMSTYVANGSISEAEADLRSMVFWGAYTLDHHWGFLLGRPIRMNLEDVTVPKPGHVSRGVEPQRWSPYGLPHPTAFPAGLSLSHSASLLSLSRVRLSEIMTPLGHVLYGSSKISREALQQLNAETTQRLLDWKENLPECLKVNVAECNSPPLPHILMLHLYYHQAIIHAHRPWMSKNGIQPQPQQGAGYVHARKMCVESATAISRLLYIYDKYYTFQRISVQAVAITCSAALMLIFTKALYRNSSNDQSTLENLNVCFRALEEFGSSWESAKRAQSFLLHMQGLWERSSRHYRGGKRVVSQSQDAAHSDHSNSPGSKRSRTSFSSAVGMGSMSSHGEDSVQMGSESEQLDWLWAVTMGSLPPTR
ncbi:fungal-specific transcription factor domain-containing protein [Penicillium angulare]|uniref:fungal-specific transcription factor domain-containing protein n=1 Tax=Penicillium angulare TaxID=116970 RepID=UPI0025424D8D|nr:fungal-specific transcription factor domain-containing protein [Penicillium angulare]KAJ5278857.1 fungal-specific transcription factor domain-containing protein [Penicillium angulare]